MLNLRGSDISYNPVFFSYLLLDVAAKKSTLYVAADKVKDLGDYLEKECDASTAPYEQIEADLAKLVEAGKKIATDTAKCNARLTGILGENCVEKPNCVALPKAKKNKTE